MRASARGHASGTERGYTLIEVLVVMLVFSITAAFATTGWLHYQRSLELRSGADQLTAVMRNAQELSLSEAVTYCITFSTDNRTYTTTKFACGAAGTQVGSPKQTPTSRVTFASVAFTQPDGTTARNVQFTPRGSATPGSVRLVRQGSSKSYTINVEGLTGRVSVG